METGLGRSMGQLLASSEGVAHRELLSLAQERDAELLGESLLSFAARQESTGNEFLASQAYAAIVEAEEGGLTASVVDRARRRLGALQGEGSFGDRAEVLARHFVSEATDPVTLLAMTVGSAAYATARAGILTRLLASPSGAWTRGLAARGLAASGAFAVEIPSFWLANKGMREVLHPGLQPWDLSTNARELATLGVSLGALKLAGFGAVATQSRLGIQNSLGASAFRQAGMFTGILAGHGLERMVGLRPASDGATTFLDSLVLLLQFNVGGRLSHQLMGPRWAAHQAGLEARLQSAIRRPAISSTWGQGLPRPLAMAAMGGDGLPPRGAEPIDFNRPQITRMEGGPSPVESPARVWQNLIQDVVRRGQRGELESLKNILRDALQAHGDKSYIEKQLQRFGTRDPEEWKSGLSRVSDMLESQATILNSIHETEPLHHFAADWNSRPHFTNFEQVPVSWGRTLGGRHKVHTFVNELRQALAVKPSLAGLRGFLSNGRINPQLSMTLERPDAEGTTVYFNWRNAGLRLQFNPEGHLRGEVLVRVPFNRGENVAEIEALPAETEVPAASAKKGGRPPKVRPAKAAEPTPAISSASNYKPQPGENPTEYAMRLLEASRSPDREAALNIVLELERQLADPNTANMARETVIRWTSLSTMVGSNQAGGIVARNYRIGAMRSNITIVSLPTTFLPESWSQTFAEGLAAYKRQVPPRPVNRAIEIGSGTGWASIVLSKLDLAQEIVAVDMNPQAAAVGRLNAALNGVRNIRFETGNLLSDLPADVRADLIIACLPQVKKNGSIQGLREVADYYAGGSGYFDRFGLGLIESALVQSRTRLERGGRILFNLGGRPGRAVLEDLLASNGFRPNLRHSVMIPQDTGTDISSLAAQEQASNQRFEFFRPEKPGEPISAVQALTISNPHHMLYFMEGRPYFDLLRQGLVKRLDEGGRLGYTRDAGTENAAVREGLAYELSRDFGFRITPEVIHLGPDGDTLLAGLLRVLPTENGRVLYAGNEAIPAPVTGYRPQRVSPNFGDIELAVSDANPTVLVLRLPREAWADREGLRQLLHRNGERGVHTVLLEDQPMRLPDAAHPLMEVLVNSVPAAGHTHIVHSLDRRYSVPSMPLSALISANSMLHLYMGRYADLTHSRASSLTQDAYAHFLGRMAEGDKQTHLPGVLDSMLSEFAPSRGVAAAVGSAPAFESFPRGEHPDPISMNFGESEWSPPLRIGSALWDAALRPATALESEAKSAVVRYLAESRGVQVSQDQLILGPGVQPLLVAALRGLRDIGGQVQVAVARPSYGLFFPTVELSGAKLVEFPTRPEGRFLTESGLLSNQLNGASNRTSAVLINEPSNPAGQYHSPEALAGIARQVQSMKGYLLFDDVFGGLDFGRSRVRRTPSMKVLSDALGSRLVTFGGLSKEFAAGGLRFGFAVVGDPTLARAIQSHVVSTPDPLALSLAPVMLQNWRQILEEHRIYLSSRAYRLEQVFRERQLPILEAQGGYSVLANLEFLYGRKLRLRNGGEATINGDNLHDLLYSEAGLKVYSDNWARQRGHYRLVFSIDRLDEAVERLKKFFRAAR